MRLRMLKDAYSPYGLHTIGQIVEIPDPPARDWLKSGLAMQDKSEDGATETKSPPPVIIKRKIKKTK